MRSNGLLIDIISIMGLIAWILASGYFLYAGNLDMFQRFGALGIVIGVIWYAAVPAPVVHPYGLLERLQIQGETLIFLGVAVRDTNMRISHIAAIIASDLRSEGRDVPPLLMSLVEAGVEAEKISNRLQDETLHYSKGRSITADQVRSDAKVAQVERVRFLTQACLVVLGTLQAGFGSLIAWTV